MWRLAPCRHPVRIRNLDRVPAAAATLAAVLARPRLRGWLHLWAFAVSVAAGVVLVAVTGATRGSEAGLATAVYALTVCLLFGTSAVYHRVRWARESRHALVARLDHSMIFLFIAGTYTPFALLAMPDRTGGMVLAVVWAGALGGVLLKSIWITAPRWLSVPLYLGLGWVAVFTLPDLLRARRGGRVRAHRRRRPALHRRRDRVRAEAAGPVAACLRLPRGLPPVHGGRRGLPHDRRLARGLLSAVAGRRLRWS